MHPIDLVSLVPLLLDTSQLDGTFLFLKNVNRPFLEKVLRNKNVPPTVFKTPAS